MLLILESSRVSSTDCLLTLSDVKDLAPCVQPTRRRWQGKVLQGREGSEDNIQISSETD